MKFNRELNRSVGLPSCNHYLVILVTGILGGGCAKSHYQAYEGTQLTAEQVARVHCREAQVIRVDSVDMRKQNSVLNFYASPEPLRDIQIDVTPGVHRISLRYRRIEGGVVHCSPNQFSILYDFKANQDYAFAISEDNQGRMTLWSPELIDKQTKTVLAKHETKPLPAKNSKAGTATIRGIAVERGATATGNDVFLIQKNDRTQRWVDGEIAYWNREPGFFSDLSGLGHTDPPEVKKPLQTTVGYGMGFFEFLDVPPGDYFIYFSSNTEMTFSVAAVTIRPGEKLVDNVKVLPAFPPSKR